MLIDCDACAVRGPACGDCVVTVVLRLPRTAPGASGGSDGGPRDAAGGLLSIDRSRWDGDQAGQVDLDQAERAAIAVLAGSGLVPPLRLVPRTEQVAAPGSEPDPCPRATGTG